MGHRCIVNFDVHGASEQTSRRCEARLEPRHAVCHLRNTQGSEGSNHSFQACLGTQRW